MESETLDLGWGPGHDVISFFARASRGWLSWDWLNFPPHRLIPRHRTEQKEVKEGKDSLFVFYKPLLDLDLFLRQLIAQPRDKHFHHLFRGLFLF